MEQQQEIGFVTGDKWLREGGYLDLSDQQILAEASQRGRYKIRFIDIPEMLETMKKEDPHKFKNFLIEAEKVTGHPLTYDQLVEFSRRANERFGEFTKIVETMTLGKATQVRTWRCNAHMTWRSLAQATWNENWFGRSWDPQSNQLMGMALAEKAAKLFCENYREPPWN